VPVEVGNLLGDGLGGWDLYANGEKVENAELFVNADGFLETRGNAATVLYMR
jgi:hypothetical protein